MDAKAKPALAAAEARVEVTRARLQRRSELAFDARPEVGLAPDAPVEALEAALKARYAHIIDPVLDDPDPQTWAEYKWVTSRAEVEHLRAVLHLRTLQLAIAVAQVEALAAGATALKADILRGHPRFGQLVAEELAELQPGPEPRTTEDGR